MRIVYLAAGAGGYYCGACMRDTALARGLDRHGHEVEFLSLYTPVKADRTPPGLCRVFFGGLNVYLEQLSGVFSHTPGFLHRLLDASWLLDFVGKFAIDTRPEDLGAMTISVLKGREGRQHRELEHLVDYLAHEARPDVVNITNSLLIAIAPEVKRVLNVKVVCNLQGEDVFVKHLGEPFSDEARELIRGHAAAVDAFVAPSASYADEMTGFLGVDRSRIRVIRPGIVLDPYEVADDRPADVFRIGYLSRITPEKGIDVLCEAFRLLEADAPGRHELTVAGEAGEYGRELWEEEMRRFADAGVAERVTHVGSPDLDGKVRFLKRLSVFSVPSRDPERQAVSTLEAMAAGCPVVATDHGVYSEIASLAAGIVLVPSENARALADALAALRDDTEHRRTLGMLAAETAVMHFSDETLTLDTLALYEELLEG